MKSILIASKKKGMHVERNTMGKLTWLCFSYAC